jgi:hypothetical protein
MWAGGKWSGRATPGPATGASDCSSSGGSTEGLLLPTPAASVPNSTEGVESWWARKVAHATKAEGVTTRAGLPLGIALRVIGHPLEAEVIGDGSRREWSSYRPH